MKDNENKRTVSIAEAAEINQVTRQAIYVAIKLNKLKASKETNRWTIHLDDLEQYKKERYSRAKSRYNGELIYDPVKGFYSIGQVAKMLGVPVQKIYYLTRIKRLKAQRKGTAWVIHESDIREYQQSESNKTQAPLQQAG